MRRSVRLEALSLGSFAFPVPPRKRFWFSEFGGGVFLLASCGQRPGILLNTLNCTTRNYPAPNVNSGETVEP